MRKGARFNVGKNFTWRQKCLTILFFAASVLAIAGGGILLQPSAAEENNVPAVVSAPAAQFCNSTPISITGSLGRGPATPYPSNITVSGVSGLTTNVSVTLNNLQHNWGRDIDVLLVGPNGEKFIIMADVGQGDGFDNPATITISDAGAARFTNQSGAILSGTYKPTNHNDVGVNDTDAFNSPAPIPPYGQPGPAPAGNATFASVFNQANPNGVWSLYIMDDASSNEGSISGGWCLNIETAAPAPNNLQFAAPNFNGDANNIGTATVNRVNGSPGAVSVNYSTGNGSATGGAACATGVDYISTSGTLNFTDGETSKTFNVQLCPDTTLEPNETINLTLSNPTGGAFIGIPGTATLTIIPAGPPATQFCNPNTINIPISGSVTPYPSTLTVSGMSGVVNSVKVTLNNIHHVWASDLDILLVAPNGRKFVLLSDIGEQDGLDTPATLTLTDAATIDLLNVNTPIPSGIYKPTNLAADDTFPSPAPPAPYNQPAPLGTATLGSTFNNINPNGTWNLFVTDDGASSGGTISGWCLDIVTGATLPDNVQFTNANYNRAANTTANVTVHRPNTSAGAVSVNYATSSGSATGGASCDGNADFISQSGTLNFADGETSKNVSVELCAGTETTAENFSITLSNPTGGATIGSPAAATVTIYNGDLPCETLWTRAMSPHVIGGTRTIYADNVVCIEPGATVQFGQNGKIHLYGEIRALGTAGERIVFTGANVSPNRIEVAGKMDLRYFDLFVPLNMNGNGSVTCRDCTVGARGTIMTFPGLSFRGRQSFVSLENVIFDSSNPVQSQNAQLYAGGLILLMKNVTFRNSAFFNVTGSQMKFENVRSENSTYEGFSFSNSSSQQQPTLLENLTVTNCTRAGLDLFSGNFLIGDNVTIQNCEYPVSGKGGIMPGSILPLTGNRNNWIEVGQPGGSAIYANTGLPYVVEGFADIGGIEFMPGVVVKARPSFDFYNEFSPSRILGLPGAPVTFEPFDPTQKWDGGQFNFSGNRLDYVVLDGMVSGIISSGGTGGNYYVDNSIIRNSTIGVIDRVDSNGAAYLQTNLFTGNQTAIVEQDARINTRQRTNPNLFENNAVAVSSTGVPDVRYNWWNSPTGPTTPANPGGTGERINGTARFLPFLTTRPDTTDRPPVVRMPRAPFAETGLLDAGKKILIRWNASDDRGIVKQKILFSRDSEVRSAFTIIADNLPPSQRSFEFTVPTVGFVQSGAEQFIRVVAIDEKGQEGFDDWMPLIPAGDPQGELIITSDVAGRVFRPGDEIPFTTQTTVGFNECSMSNYLIFDADRRIISLGVNTIVRMPPISTDTARLMRICSRTYNQQRYFFSEPFAIRYDPRFPDTAPTISINSPTAGQQFAAGQIVPVTWTASDDESIRHFNIQSSSDNGRTWIQVAENLPPTTTSYDWQPAVRGNLSDVRIRVIAVDRRFQNSSDTHSINFVAPPNAPPSVQVTFPANGANYTVGQSTFVAANAADPDGQIQRVEFYVAGSAFTPQTDPAFIGSDTTAPYQVPWVYPFAQGYVVTARAFDNRNQMIVSAPINVTVNPFNPAPLPIGRPELTNPVDGATFPAGSNITLEGLPAPTHRTIVRVEFYNGTTLVGTDTTAPYSITLNNVPAGKYTFFVKSVADNNAESISPVTDVIVGGAALRHTPFDFDGDGKADVSIFRPANGEWWINRSASGTIAYQFGSETDKIVPGDYTGDGKTDAAVWRSSTGEWFILRSEDSSFYAFPFGTSGDIPAPADYDGDGISDAAVFRPSNATWYINKSSGGILIQQFGVSGDVPVTADYDGDGKADIAIYRASAGEWWIWRSTAGLTAFQFGNSNDKPVPGDYTGDGKTDAAFYRPANGEWFILRSEDQSYFSFPFGANGDAPAPGDYDGDGKTDAAVFRPSNSTWFIHQTTAGILIQSFGTSGDKAIPNSFIP